MALDQLDSISKLKGLKVEVTKKGHKFVGTIDHYEKGTGVLGILMNGKMHTTPMFRIKGTRSDKKLM